MPSNRKLDQFFEPFPLFYVVLELVGGGAKLNRSTFWIIFT